MCRSRCSQVNGALGVTSSVLAISARPVIACWCVTAAMTAANSACSQQRFTGRICLDESDSLQNPGEFACADVPSRFSGVA